MRCFLVVTQTKIASEQEFELMNYLFHKQGYNPLVRPVANISEALRVNLGLCMIKLIHLVGSLRHTTSVKQKFFPLSFVPPKPL